MAELSSRRRSLKAPIHNPYDKFTQPEFDAWIDGITGVLRKALGHEEEEEETAPETATYDEEPSVTPQDDSPREYEETDEGQSETEELDVEKGKARDPREGPGLGSGTIDEPIELESDEEEEGTQQELEGTQDDDGYEEYEEGEEADEDDARTSGWRETGDNQTHYQKNEESEREEEEDEDDWEEREYRRKGKNWTSEEHSRPYESESRSRALPMGHQKDRQYVEDEYEDEYDEEGEYDEYEEGYDEAEEGPEPIVISEDEEEEENDENVPPVRQFEVKRGPQVATRTQDDDEDEEDGTHERSHLDFEAQHDAETEEDIDGEGVDYDELSEDQLLAGNSDKENIVHEIDESEDYMQHPETHTAFSLNQSDETSEEQPISIRDPWSGPKIFAEDFYSGGDIRLPLDSTLDVNYLNEFDAPSSDIGNFLTPGVMTPSLIGSEGLVTPDALLSRTPQHSEDQEETQMVETSGRAYEHHPVESEDALSFAPTGRDQQEVEIIDTEPSDDVFDFGSFHQSSQPSLKQVTVSAPAQDSLLQMADSVVKAAVSGLAVQTEAMEDVLVETSVYLPIQNDLDIQEFAKDSTPEIIDVDTDELDEFMDGVTGHKGIRICGCYIT
ncbi:hypothetical protein K435DRAFT_137749 [Dendrothele bispora CBS 962.96]|uniref:Uncharacterized protein n=1 Tax=Dendrothele bispora (strain CBS 962.96) TaxID=1314807 RepID=A0A4S8MQP2_DENBC|nr:hypothetical protein K435DRAFT_137749 [Dendrothele bispora CBS 962.96]